MFLTGWLHTNGWMVGCLTNRLAGSVAGWQYGWLALRLISYVAGCLAGFVAAGYAVLWLCEWLYWLALAM